jgi:phosphate transport system substrate-binding protein
MTVQWGKCLNIIRCDHAASKQQIPIPTGAAFVCPECLEPLQVEIAEPSKKPRSKRTVKILMAALVSLILLAAVGGFIFLGSMRHADAAVAKNVPHTILRLAGSNTIGDSLGPALAEAFLQNLGATNVRITPGADSVEKIVEGTLPGENTPSAITVAAHGSATAFTALSERNCDIGMASRKIKPEEAAKLSSLGEMSSFTNEHILGLDGIAVIVNAANPANQMDKSTIMRIFTGDISDWSQVGASHGEIKIYARNDSSGTYDTFKSLVLAGKPLASAAQRIEDSKVLSDQVAADPKGIGFIGLPYIQSAKPVAVSDKGTQALLPTRLTVGTEDYLLSRRLYLYTPSNPANPYTRRFIEFALSKKGQDIVGSSGFIAQNVAQVTQTVSSEAPAEYKFLTKDANRLSLDFRFASGQTDLDNKAHDDLDRVVSLIADLKIPADKVMLFGFSDSIGSPALNQVLSLNRAKAVASQFTLRGMTPAIVRGYGSGLAVASDANEEGLARNRRVEIWIKK